MNYKHHTDDFSQTAYQTSGNSWLNTVSNVDQTALMSQSIYSNKGKPSPTEMNKFNNSGAKY